MDETTEPGENETNENKFFSLNPDEKISSIDQLLAKLAPGSFAVTGPLEIPSEDLAKSRPRVGKSITSAQAFEPTTYLFETTLRFSNEIDEEKFKSRLLKKFNVQLPDGDEKLLRAQMTFMKYLETEAINTPVVPGNDNGTKSLPIRICAGNIIGKVIFVYRSGEENEYRVVITMELLDSERDTLKEFGRRITSVVECGCKSKKAFFSGCKADILQPSFHGLPQAKKYEEAQISGYSRVFESVRIQPLDKKLNLLVVPLVVFGCMFYALVDYGDEFLLAAQKAVPGIFFAFIVQLIIFCAAVLHGAKDASYTPKEK